MLVLDFLVHRQRAERKLGAHTPCAELPVHDLYLLIQNSCAYEQKAHGLVWVWSIGVARNNAVFTTLMGFAKRLEA